jgi:hypothetical protein
MARKTDRLQPLGDVFGMKIRQGLKAVNTHRDVLAARLKPCPCMLESRDVKMDSRFGGKADCPLGHLLLSLFER